MCIIIRLLGTIKRGYIEAIRIAEQRADLIIFSGGLGPTKDDLTKETIARHLRRELSSDDSCAMDSIEQFFTKQKSYYDG